MARKNRVNFLHALFGLPTNPVATAQRLILEPEPPYTYSLLMCTLITIFVPIITQIHFLQIDAFKADLFYSLIIVIFFTLVVFSIFEVLILQLFGIDIKWHQMMATISYSSTPLMFVLLVVYIFNYFVNGSVTLLTRLLTGYSPIADSVLDLIPVAYAYFQIVSCLVFASCIKQVSHGHWLSSLVITLLSIVPFYLCIVIGLALSEFAVPGTISTVYQIAPWFERLLEII